LSAAQTVLAYINGLKWLVFVGVLVYWFRVPLAALLRRISSSEQASISGFGVTVSWEDDLKQASDSLGAGHSAAPAGAAGATTPAKTVPAPEPAPAPEATVAPASAATSANGAPAASEAWADIDELLASRNASAAVLMAWKRVEMAVKAHTGQPGLDASTPLTGRRLAEAAQLPRDLDQALQSLMRLRDTTAHTTNEPSGDQAETYVDLAKRFVDAVSGLA
jgi:hypothetical protein